MEEAGNEKKKYCAGVQLHRFAATVAPMAHVVAVLHLALHFTGNSLRQRKSLVNRVKL